MGMNETTGKELDGFEHLKQSIRRLLTTPIGSRVMNRTYGSRLFNLIDQPINPVTQALIYQAVAEALDQWEPRYELEQVSLHRYEQGALTINLVGRYVPTGEQVTIENLEV
ncbi:GPW/gp25 family protein [Marinomonas ostreistagni]|uniref:GPW/gp25 family protein n=1 Tax=Marinomonas ostreistagni TaxID=359209 RepID=A0ABS0ZAR4_9GAMM|nr:GPW/gp25 family protein [Marinomonas ostreistagni]MBJ7550740.1 GPW/gp25 family protein [Marinomonas ostreistagni]